MIHLTENKACCGCWGCVSKCPQQCITMQEDSEGFLYPHVDQSRCIDCGLCEKVCPKLNPFSPVTPLDVQAATHSQDSVRLASSSGGVFSSLAESVLSRGGVVFGARFDEQWTVMHDYTETIKGLAPFRGSKYVQSRTGHNYRTAEEFLKAGREVLFCGTPCQISGLHRYLGRNYDRLLTVDFICHGVPSPKIWRKYLEERRQILHRQAGGEPGVIDSVNFRDKAAGWHCFSLAIQYKTSGGKTNRYRQTVHTDPYLKGFVQNIYLRPSCYDCSAKKLSAKSDITLGDLWGGGKIIPGKADDKGLSVVFLNTPKALSYQQTFVNQGSVPYENVAQANPALNRSVPIPSGRERFFMQIFDSVPSLSEKINRYTTVSSAKRIRKFMGRILRKIGFIK